MTRFRSNRWLLYLPIVLGPVLLLSPVILTGRALFWGTPILQFVPWSSWAWQTLSNGQLPLWNPLLGMGAPLLGNYQSALLYPPNWLLLSLFLLGGTPLLAWGQALLIALHLIWAGLGMVFLARKLRLGILAQTISGLAYGLSGYLVARSGFLSINAAVSWLPWIMLAILSMIQSDHQPEKRGKFFLFAYPIFLSLALCFQLLAGHAQTTWYTLFLGAIWTIFLSWQYSRGETLAKRVKSIFRGLGKYVVACLSAVALAAIQLLPTAEYLLQSQRESGLDIDFAMVYSFSPWRFITLLAPDFFGNPRSGNFWGYANYWEDAVYIGLISFLLALGTALAFRRKTDPQLVTTREPAPAPTILLLWVITIISFVLALGKNTPVFPWLYAHIPTFDMFLAPTRFSIWAIFSLALLAGYGADRWHRPRGRTLYWARLGTAGAFAVILGAILTPLFAPQTNPTELRSVALAGFWAAGVGILCLTAPIDQSKAVNQAWMWAVVTLLCADLIVAHYNLNPAEGLTLYRTPSPSAEAIQEITGGHRIYVGEQDEYALKFDRFFRFDTFYPGEDWGNLREVFLPNMNMLENIPAANNFDPLVPARYARWMKFVNQADQQTRNSLLALMDVGATEQVDQATSSGVSFTKTPEAKRLRWVPCAIPVEDQEQALHQVANRASQADFFDTTVIVENPPNSITSECLNVGKTAQVELVSETPSSLEINYNAPAAGWLVISDVWYPGWRAKIDGHNTPISPANYSFRALSVPPGNHRVTLEYKPPSVLIGALISLIAWVGIGLLAWLQRGYSKPRPISSGLTTLDSE